MDKDTALPIALLALRAGLGIFLVLWSIDKLAQPETTIKVFAHFYGTDITLTAARVIGSLELMLSVALTAGLWKTWTYGTGLLLHSISTLSSYHKLLSPFGQNHLFIAGIPVLAAFFALFLLRHEDTLLSGGRTVARKS
ncbi:MAG: hypothetical protein B7Z66_11470 [Chromatiales bacterium 21-64-14]|nr:MAG: hypothetical protein B7Z66_11470 [Chromatiales bacterium 21-64-14]HQU16730.1 DoxX family membrane protein [Gammaproteobacteria bacterium]